MTELINSCTKDGLNVVIGDENASPAMKNASLVTASTVSNGQRATIGVIGPERMDYEKVIGAIDKVLQALELEEENGEDD